MSNPYTFRFDRLNSHSSSMLWMFTELNLRAGTEMENPRSNRVTYFFTGWSSG